MTSQSLEIVESIDVIESIAMECLGQSCSLGVLIEDTGQDLDNRKISLTRHVAGEQRCELFTKAVGHLKQEMLINV